MKNLSNETKLKIGNANRMTNEEFFRRLHEKYDGVYSLEKVIYKTLKDKITLICPIHGEFELKASTAISKEKKGKCPLCHKIENAELSSKRMKGKYIMSTDTFIKKANVKFNNKYDYSKVDMLNRRDDGKVCIICHELDENGEEHGEFWQKPNQHLYGKSCPKCGRRLKTTTQTIDEFKNVHGEKYDYSLVNYESSVKKVEIICKKCNHHFFMTPHNHKKGKGCPICKESKLEKEIRDFLTENNIGFEEQKRFEWLKTSNNNSQTLDFYLPQHNVAIECQGIQHFQKFTFFGGDEKFEKVKKLDKRKFDLCKEHKIKLIYFSNLGIIYPYKVFENKEELILEIFK